MIKGDYKYSITVQFDKKDQFSETFLQTTLNSMKITKPSSSLGTIKDSDDDYDRSKKKLVKSKSNGYSIRIPEYWKAESSKTTSIVQTFSHNYGGFVVVTSDKENVSPKESIQLFKSGMTTKIVASDLKEIENRSETIAGVDAVWITWEYKDTLITAVALDKNGTTYILSETHVKAVDTPFMKTIVNDAIKSFQLIN